MKKIYLTMILSLALSPFFAFGQEELTVVVTSEEEVTMDDETTLEDDATTTEEVVMEEEVVVEEEMMDDETPVVTEEELEVIMNESIPVSEDVAVIEGEVIASDDGVVYVQTDDGIVSIDTNDEVNSNVIIRSGGGKKKKTIVVSSGDKITLATGSEVTIDQAITGKIIRLVNDVITVLLANGQEKTITLHGSASYVKADGTKASASDLQVGDDVTMAVDDEDNAYQVITGTPEELAELQEGDDMPTWLIALIVALGATVLGWFVFKK